MTYLFMYRVRSDTGLAPCVDNGLLSLACCKGGQIRNGKPCKTGLRYRIGNKNECDYTKDDVYILGTYQNKFLYLAHITDVMTMTDYYSGISKGRTDNIYHLVEGKLERNNSLRDKGVHLDSVENERDFAGKYVLLSKDYIYLGKDAVYIDVVDKYGSVFQETKLYSGNIAKQIIDECRKADDGKSHKPNNPFKSKCGGCK